MSKRARKTRPADGGSAETAFDAVVNAFSRDRTVTVGSMFSAGNVVLKVNGKIFAMLVRGTFVIKLPQVRVDAMVSAAQGVRFEGGKGRPMKEWICVALDPGSWVDLAREAKQFVSGG